MLNIIRPDDPVQIRYLNQPQDNISIDDEESKDIETLSKELDKMGLKFDNACKDKINEDKQDLAKTEKLVKLMGED